MLLISPFNQKISQFISIKSIKATPHFFLSYFFLQQNCLRCPICKQIHGVLRGDQPPGRMTHRTDMSQSVGGYEGDGLIVITYDIPGGIQVIL